MIDCEQLITPTLINSWTDYGNGYSTVGYWKDSFGYVHLKGAVSNPSQVINNTIFTLPDGYKPLSSIEFVVSGLGGWNGKSAFWTIIKILPDGSVNVGNDMVTSRVCLDEINFRAGV